MTTETSTKSTIEWTNEDSKAAVAQGWDIFTTERGPSNDVPFELQRDDEASVFATDHEAHAFVKTQAATGAEPATKALNYLKEASPLEYDAIMGESGS